MNTDLKHYLFFSMSQVLRVLLSMITMALLARRLGPTGIGHWSMIIACATLFHLVLANWLQQDSFLKFGKEEWSRTQSVVDTWNARLLLVLPGLLIAGFLLLGFPWTHVRSFFELDQRDGILVLGFFLSLWLSIEVQTWLQITGRMASLAFAPIWIAGLCIPFYALLYVKDFSIPALPLALGGTILITISVWGGLWISNLTRFSWHFHWLPQKAWDILHFSSPILPMTLLSYVVNWGNQVLIQKLFQPQDVGFYQSAFQIHFLLVSLAVPLTTIILPRLIDKQLEEPGIMKRYVRDIAPTLFCLWLLALIPCITFLPTVFVWVYGRSFLNSIPLLAILLSGTIFCGLGQIYTGLYNAQGRLSPILWIVLTTVSLNFLIAWIWVPAGNHSLTRAAVCFSAFYVLAQYLLFYNQHHHLKESAFKLIALIAGTLLFSLGQSVLLSLGWRLVWGAACWMMLVLIIRGTRAIDVPTLKQLFTGRLSPLGNSLLRLLVS